MTNIAALFLIIASAALTIGGNGLAMTLTAVGGSAQGYNATLIGLLGTAYYLGQLLAAFIIPPVLRPAGHIRVFAGLAALAAIALLVMALSSEMVVWFASRLAGGVAFGGVAMVIESWMMTSVDPARRGRLMSVYRIADLGSVTGVQFLLPVFGTSGAEIYIVNGILFCASLIPLTLSKLHNPEPPQLVKVSPRWLWGISPVAMAGVATLALVNGAFRTVGPIYAQEVGLDATGIAAFIAASVLAGAIFQYPLGWYSDRVDRRHSLLISTAGASVASLALFFADPSFAVIGAFFFGGFAFPLYSLSVAHAYDFAEPRDYVRLSAGFMMTFSLMAAIGPLLASAIMQAFGPSAFFLYTAFLHTAFILFVVWRMQVRDAPPSLLRRRFVGIMRNSPLVGHFFSHGLSEDEDEPELPMEEPE
jgi:MFS family permease